MVEFAEQMWMVGCIAVGLIYGILAAIFGNKKDK